MKDETPRVISFPVPISRSEKSGGGGDDSDPRWRRLEELWRAAATSAPIYFQIKAELACSDVVRVGLLPALKEKPIEQRVAIMMSICRALAHAEPGMPDQYVADMERSIPIFKGGAR